MKDFIEDFEGQISRLGNEATFCFFYPRQPSSVKYLEVELMDVRAADSIRISYDFDRDGSKIEQASKFEWDDDDSVCDSDWQEVAFIKAWAREAP